MRDLRGASERSYVSMSWGQVHLRRAGSPTAPALVMLHQSPLSSATFEEVLAPLAARGLHVVAIDTPGFGLSDPTPEQWSIAQYAEAVGRILDRLDLGRVVLVGQHTGAVIACEVAAQRPQALAGLVLQGLPLYDEAERTEKRAGYAPGYSPTADGSHLSTIHERIRGLYPAASTEVVDRQVAEYLATGPDYGTAYRAVFDHRVDLDAVRALPVALVHGDRDLVHRFTDTVVAALPEAHLDVVPGSDFAPDEHPVEFADAVARRAREFHGIAVAYTARVEVSGGRAGSARSLTGTLTADLARPAERGTDAGTDPEELFAAGFAACFDSALQVVARRERAALGPTTTTGAVSLCVGPAQDYTLAVELSVAAPECEQAELDRLVALAHHTCPYAKATQGNIPLKVTGIGRA